MLWSVRLCCLQLICDLLSFPDCRLSEFQQNQDPFIFSKFIYVYFTDFLFQMAVLDKTEQLQKELSTLQSELDRIVYLLKIADPAGEAARKRESNSQDPKPNLFKVPISASVRKTKSEPNRKTESEKSVSGSNKKQETTDVTLGKKTEESEVIVDKTECKAAEYVAVKPQWLGAVQKTETIETKQEGPLEMQESDQFVDYKDRKKVLEHQDATKLNVESGIENAAPGLIIRKRKQVVNETEASEQSTTTSKGAEIRAEDAVALLLKHKRGYYASDDEAGQKTEDTPRRKQPGKDNKKPKKVLGPEKPSFLGDEMDYETWVPPEGKILWLQSNDNHFIVCFFMFSFLFLFLLYFDFVASLLCLRYFHFVVSLLCFDF